MTLLEVIVVIAIMSVMAAIVGVSQPWHDPDETNELDRMVNAARARAIRLGRAVQVRVPTPGDTAIILALPDGSIIAYGIPEPEPNADDID